MSESDEYPRLPPTHGDDTWRRLEVGGPEPADDDDAPELGHDAVDDADDTPNYRYGDAYDADDLGEYSDYDVSGPPIHYDPGHSQANGSGRAGAPEGWQGQAQPGESLGEVARQVTGSEMVKIGLWGSPASGKTTFIAALRHATATSASNDCGTWGIFPVNARSRDLLVDLTQELTQGKFPKPRRQGREANSGGSSSATSPTPALAAAAGGDAGCPPRAGLNST